jgi:hypothetical protein
MKAVKEVLKQKKLPTGYPPTKADVKMREKHVPESVDYNIQEHARDHVSNAIDQIKKLHQVNPSQAHSYAAKSLATLRELSSDLENHTNGNCKECK